MHFEMYLCMHHDVDEDEDEDEVNLPAYESAADT